MRAFDFMWLALLSTSRYAASPTPLRGFTVGPSGLYSLVS